MVGYNTPHEKCKAFSFTEPDATLTLWLAGYHANFRSDRNRRNRMKTRVNIGFTCSGELHERMDIGQVLQEQLNLQMLPFRTDSPSQCVLHWLFYSFHCGTLNLLSVSTVYKSLGTDCKIMDSYSSSDSNNEAVRFVN